MSLDDLGMMIVITVASTISLFISVNYYDGLAVVDDDDGHELACYATQVILDSQANHTTVHNMPEKKKASI